MPKTALVILNWNNWQDTIECLASVFQSTADDYRVILVDNGSRDDSITQITAWAQGGEAAPSNYLAHTRLAAPLTVVTYDCDSAKAGGRAETEMALSRLPANRQLVLVRAETNLGFAGGSNVGLRYALVCGFDYALLLNNDTVVANTALEILTGFMDAQPAIDAATGQIRYYSQPDRIWNCGGEIAWYAAPRYLYGATPASQAPQQGWVRVTFATGCALILRCSALRATGLLTERFFHGEEDFELALRFRRQGRLMACCFGAIIYHKVNATIRKTSGHSYLRQTYIHYLSRFIDMRTYWPWPIWQIWRWCYTVYVVLALWIRRRAPLRNAMRMGMALLTNSEKLDRVDRRTFEQVLETNQWLS